MNSPLKLSPNLVESFKLSSMLGESLKLSPNFKLSPKLGDPPLNGKEQGSWPASWTY